MGDLLFFFRLIVAILPKSIVALTIRARRFASFSAIAARLFAFLIYCAAFSYLSFSAIIRLYASLSSFYWKSISFLILSSSFSRSTLYLSSSIALWIRLSFRLAILLWRYANFI